MSHDSQRSTAMICLFLLTFLAGVISGFMWSESYRENWSVVAKSDIGRIQQDGE